MSLPARKQLRGPRRLRYAAEAAALHALAAFVLLLPRRGALALGRGIGALLFAVSPALRRVARANLDIAFGASLSPAAKTRIARHGLQNAAATLLGLFWAPRLTRARLDRLVTLDPDQLAPVRRLHAAGRGIIFVTMHYGDWELLGLAMGFWGVPMTIIQEPMRNRRLSDCLASRRAVSGHTIRPGKRAALELFRTLKRGGTATLLVDLNATRKGGGIWLDFFGLPVFNSPAAAMLARRAGATIICCLARPLPGGRYGLTLSPPLEPVDTGHPDEDIRALSQRCLDTFAAVIRREPDHWLWTYKRWKFRPTADQGQHPWYSAPLDRATRPTEPDADGQ